MTDTILICGYTPSELHAMQHTDPKRFERVSAQSRREDEHGSSVTTMYRFVAMALGKPWPDSLDEQNALRREFDSSRTYVDPIAASEATAIRGRLLDAGWDNGAYK